VGDFQVRIRLGDKEEPPKEATHYPKIKYTDKCSEAVLALLETPWGNTPRSIRELREAMAPRPP